MAKQRRPNGRMWAVDQAFKDAVSARMKERNINRAELARRVGASSAAITVFFRKTTGQSRLVPKIQRVLDLVDTAKPVTAVEQDAAFRRLMKAWSSLSDDERAHVIATSEMLASKR